MRESISPALFWWQQPYVTTICGLVVGMTIVEELWVPCSAAAARGLAPGFQLSGSSTHKL